VCTSISDNQGGSRLKTNWASSAFSGTDVFEALHSGLTVKLVSTPRHQLKTCRKTDLVSDVLDRNPDEFDFIPVLDDSDDELSFVGLFHAADMRNKGTVDGSVSAFQLPLAEDHLVGADASILDFIVQADRRPCRLVVSGSRIVGLVTLSDLQRLPVRAALFALVTGFEMTMADLIKAKLPDESAWMAMLKPTRLDKIQHEISIAQAKDAFVDKLLFTQFADKAEILKRLNPTGMHKLALERQLRDFQNLRDSLAHANEYAASPEQAKHVCDLVRKLLGMRREICEHL
jgi:CBS domain-containing protein